MNGISISLHQLTFPAIHKLGITGVCPGTSASTPHAPTSSSPPTCAPGHHHLQANLPGSATPFHSNRPQQRIYRATMMKEQPPATFSGTLVRPQQWLGMYSDFIVKNVGAVSQIESALRSLTYIIPGEWVLYGLQVVLRY